MPPEVAELPHFIDSMFEEDTTTHELIVNPKIIHIRAGVEQAEKWGYETTEEVEELFENDGIRKLGVDY